MAIKLHFGPDKMPERPTLLLATRNGTIKGIIQAQDIDYDDSLNDASNLSFVVYKELDGKREPYWDDIKNFSLIYWADQDVLYEASVEVDEQDETRKTVSCVRLGPAELSQIVLYDIEINTETDIARDDYKPTTIFNADDPEASLLNRIMEKAPHYSIGTVDKSIARMQRTFTFNNKSIYDAHQEIAAECECLFEYPSGLASDGTPNRIFNVHDLHRHCSYCGHREIDGAFTEANGVYTCPECGQTGYVQEGYGEDTGIFVTADMLAASQNINLQAHADAVKNCLRVQGGDDIINAAVRSCNPNGTEYIWQFNEDSLADMSSSLKERLIAYSQHYDDIVSNQITLSDLKASQITQYNRLVNKYQRGSECMISNIVSEYSELTKQYYNALDLKYYLTTSMMPSAETMDTTAQEQAEIVSEITEVGYTNISNLSTSTATNIVLDAARIYVDTRYSVVSNGTATLTKVSDKHYTWSGNLVITNLYNEDDTYTFSYTVAITDDYGKYVQRVMDRALKRKNTENMSMSSLINKDVGEFSKELAKYSLDYLNSILDAIQACLDVLIEQGVGNAETWSGENPNLYNDLYLPYTQKLTLTNTNIGRREKEIAAVDTVISCIEKTITDIHTTLDIKAYLGTDLWKELAAYRREDTYEDGNYISDGLSSSEIVSKAEELLDRALVQMDTTATLQHSISTTLNNLLGLAPFSALVDSFVVGNWIRVEIDDEIYKLRLLRYSVSEGDDTISVEFSDVVQMRDGVSDVKSILDQSQQMATSFEMVANSAEKGANANQNVEDWFKNGLDATNIKLIGGAERQSQTWDDHGMLFRRYNSVGDGYDDTQLKIVNSTIAITDDNWQTVKTAIGKFLYRDPVSGELLSAFGINGEVIIGKLLLGESLGLYNSAGTMTFNEDGLAITNGVNTVNINPNSTSLFEILKGTSSIFSVNSSGDAEMTGIIHATGGSIDGDMDVNGTLYGAKIQSKNLLIEAYETYASGYISSFNKAHVSLSTENFSGTIAGYSGTGTGKGKGIVFRSSIYPSSSTTEDSGPTSSFSLSPFGVLFNVNGTFDIQQVRYGSTSNYSRLRLHEDSVVLGRTDNQYLYMDADELQIHNGTEYITLQNGKVVINPGIETLSLTVHGITADPNALQAPIIQTWDDPAVQLVAATWTECTRITLSAGTYLLIGSASFASSTGIKAAYLTTNSTPGSGMTRSNSFRGQTSVAAGIVGQFAFPIKITSSTTFYFYAYSSTACQVYPGLRYIKFA